ncbi:AAA-like domain-containing protein [Aerosakkonemataceae cyanobacterium BLCC-F154]|uniref:AAA-like domain-containing protein n=1 Tax=Floridaenema fluviatile BLCC-F154 TaxID=3153640 RepID=A0ABV4Y6R5_9CYAN
MKTYEYQVGGSLKFNAPSYVERQADLQLYNALVRREFCYVLNSRQMGKSSLRLRVRHQLEQAGMRCASIDMTRIGSKNITPQQWYKGIVVDLLKGFNIYGKFNLKQWWESQESFSDSQKLSLFIEEILLQQIPDRNLYIFIDEIDSILSLNFPIDDFFALIRYCYNQRAENPEYDRLTWALFGVATPSDLIRDKNRTPFNIGRAIDLQGFQWHEVKPLIQGLVDKVNHPEAIVKEILTWTGGQPFLTQKICNLVKVLSQESIDPLLTIPLGTEAYWVERLVQTNIIEDWETQDEPEHLRTIRDRILRNEQQASALLGLYQQILQKGEILIDETPEQMELLLSGLVIKNHGFLICKNRIYQQVFNLQWVTQQLSNLRPYSQLLDAWVNSHFQDESRLLRGQALIDAQAWAEGKSLSNLDYQFLAASQKLAQQEIQRTLVAEREAKEILSAAQQKAKQTIRRGFIGLIIISCLAVIFLGVSSFLAYQSAEQKRRTVINEIRALALSSKSFLAANQEFDALLEGIKAAIQLEKEPWTKENTDLKMQVETSLQQAIYWIKERNRLSGHEDSVLSVNFSPNNQIIASGGREGTVKLWTKNGQLIRTLRGHKNAVWGVVWSPNGELIVSTSEDKTAKIWRKDGKELHTLRGHKLWVVNAAFSPDGKKIATASWDGTIKIWDLNGEELRSLKVPGTGFFDVSFSPDNSSIAGASRDGKVHIWNQNGEELSVINAHEDWVFSVAFSPDGKSLATSSRDGSVKIWRLEKGKKPQLRTNISGHKAAVFRLRFSPDSQKVATTSWDTTTKLWNLDGEEIQTFQGHNDSTWNLAFSPDGKTLATTGEDKTVKLWNLQPGLKTFRGHESAIRGVSFSPDGTKLATAGMDMTVKIWSIKKSETPTLIQTLSGFNSAIRSVTFSPDSSRLVTANWGSLVEIWNLENQTPTLEHKLAGHQEAVWNVAVSPDGETIASAGEDRTIRLWSFQGKEKQILRGHQAGVLSLSFSPDGQTIASASKDKTVKFWRWDNRSKSYIADVNLSDFEDWVIGVSFAADGKTLATVKRNGVVKFWDFQPGKMPVLRSTIPGQNDSVWSASFNFDDKRIAFASEDGTVKLWSQSSDSLKTLRGHLGAVRSISFSADGMQLASADSSGKVILWNLELDMDLPGLLARGCYWMKDYLQYNSELTDGDRQLCQNVKLGTKH